MRFRSLVEAVAMTYEQYLQHAEECEQLAKIAKLPSNQQALLSSAEMWRKLADAKRRDAVGSDREAR